jgi:hypothetical protein
MSCVFARHDVFILSSNNNLGLGGFNFKASPARPRCRSLLAMPEHDRTNIDSVERISLHSLIITDIQIYPTQNCC